MSSVSSVTRTTATSRSVSQAAATSPISAGAPGSSATARVHHIIEPFGAHTRTLFKKYNIPKHMHETLWDIEKRLYDDEVVSALSEVFNTTDDTFLAEMFDAMKMDDGTRS